MGEKTMESKAKTQNGIKRVVFSGIAILLEIIFLLNIFMRLNYYTQILNWTTHIVAILLVLGLYASHQTASMKMPWIILIMSAPILGVTLYLLIGLNGHTRKMKERYRLIGEALYRYLPDNSEISKQLSEKNPKASGISEYIRRNADYPVYANTDVTYF